MHTGAELVSPLARERGIATGALGRDRPPPGHQIVGHACGLRVAGCGLKVGGRLRVGRPRLLRSVDGAQFHRCAVALHAAKGREMSVVREWCAMGNGGCLPGMKLC